MAGRRLIEAFEEAIGRRIYRVQRLPLPVSFLMEGNKILAIYKGPVGLDLVVADLEASRSRTPDVPFDLVDPVTLQILSLAMALT